MGSTARRTATNVRLAEEAFYASAELAAGLSLPAIAEATRGASIVYRDPLLTLLAREKGPEPLAYAVVSVRRNGERSPLSNIVALTPDIAPQAPELLPPILEEGRVCLEWTAPAKNVPAAAGRDRRIPRLPPPALAGGVRRAADDRRRSSARPSSTCRLPTTCRSPTRCARCSRRTRRSRACRPRRSSSSRATSIRRRPRRASTPCRSGTWCACSGIPWTRRTWRATSSSAPRPAARRSS